MTEMTVDERDIAEYGARLLDYTVSGTVIVRTTGTSYNANFPKLFHSDYGQRSVAVTLVFKPKYPKNSGIIAKLHSLTLQKSAFDALICKDIVDIGLPDGFYYNCVLLSVGNELFDGESLEVTYTLSGIRHLKMARISGTEINCSSTVRTDCRIIATAKDDWGEEAAAYIYLNRHINPRGIRIANIKSGDVIVLDGMRCVVTKNGENAFSDTNITMFPQLNPGKNTVVTMGVQQDKMDFVTEYYPTFI